MTDASELNKTRFWITPSIPIYPSPTYLVRFAITILTNMTRYLLDLAFSLSLSHTHTQADISDTRRRKTNVTHAFALQKALPLLHVSWDALAPSSSSKKCSISSRLDCFNILAKKQGMGIPIISKVTGHALRASIHAARRACLTWEIYLTAMMSTYNYAQLSSKHISKPCPPSSYNTTS